MHASFGTISWAYLSFSGGLNRGACAVVPITEGPRIGRQGCGQGLWTSYIGDITPPPPRPLFLYTCQVAPFNSSRHGILPDRAMGA